MAITVALAQINTIVGDFEGNGRKILACARRAAEAGARLVVFPELTLTGYPPLDLLDYPAFVDASREALAAIAPSIKDIAALIGYVERVSDDPAKPLRNAAALVDHGTIVSRHYKTLLPTYDVFDEARYFGPAHTVEPAILDGMPIGVTICEDIWEPAGQDEVGAAALPLSRLSHTRPGVVVNLSASPYHEGKSRLRIETAAAMARKYGFPVLLANLVGGNDSLLFDGASFAVSAEGALRARAAEFREDLLLVELGKGTVNGARIENEQGDDASVHAALVTGLRDYAAKTGFSSVTLGLSGGIDSSVTACIACAALGSGSVLGVAMPSRYTSPDSLEDARALAANLDIPFKVIPIQPTVDAFLGSLADTFAGRTPDTTEENIQARVRGVILMAVSNKLGHLVLATGNKSELSVGYCTLYGDMAGGLAVLGDAPKALVYRLARHINRERERIPARVLTKPPSAELREDQKDTDSLPPYDRLDSVLRRLIEERSSPERLLSEGVDRDLVSQVWRMITLSEHKRKQAPLVLRVTTKAFGFGRRMPVAARMDQF